MELYECRLIVEELSGETIEILVLNYLTQLNSVETYRTQLLS